ncbi:DUF2987 domain-containing protein [Corallincola platygyrae]|uniref:DUF2987 domain-containing protein n=1 Tax=Corallincola platygyrae TaxID=1193278 RepID=A0ABW4XN01_9GAMM
MQQALGESFESVTMEYKPFYQRLKVLYKGNYADSDVGFYFYKVNAKDQPCDITGGRIFNKNYELPLVYTAKGRLYIPYEKQLYSDKAFVTVESESACELSISLELKRPQTDYRSQDLKNKAEQLYALMRDFAGVGSILLPNQQGITVDFEVPSSVSYLSASGAEIEQGEVSEQQLISLKQLSEMGSLHFSSQPSRISLWLATK